MKMTTTCITCLDEISSFDYKSMTQDLEIDGKTETFSNMISLCTGLEFCEDNELKTPNICFICVKQLTDAYVFRQNCWKSYSVLKSQVKDLVEDSKNFQLSAQMISISQEEIYNNVISKLQGSDETIINFEPDLEHSNDGYADSELELVSKKKKKTNSSLNKTKETDTRSNQKKEKKIFPKLICPICGKLVSSGGNGVQYHMLVHTNKKPFKCELCNYKATAKLFLTRHVKLVHNKTERYACEHPNCGKTYEMKSSLIGHRAKHRDPQFECTRCQKKFHTTTLYNNHMKIHNIDTYVSCDFCDKKFARKCKMMEHRKTHTKEFVHFCDVCGKGFIHRHLWRTHMKKQHNKIVT